MSDVKKLGEELRSAVTQFLFPLRTAKRVNRIAFEELEHFACLLAAELKSSDVVSKSLLNELYSTVGIIRAEAPYVKGETDNLRKMADKIQVIFDGILCGESCDDRKPGVPRVR